MDTMDKINGRYGRGTVRISAQDDGQGWEMRQERKSPKYTTCWQELPLTS